MSKRLFLGTLLSAEQSHTLLELKLELDPLLKNCWNDCQLRWVKPEKLHITWLFLGDCDLVKEVSVLEILKAKLSGISSLSLQYDQLEIFASKTRPVAGVLIPKTITNEVQELGTLLRMNLGQFCQKKADFSFRPHLTLFRFRSEQRSIILRQEQLDLSKYLPLKHDITNVSLIESHSGKRKDAYEQIAEFKLVNQ